MKGKLGAAVQGAGWVAGEHIRSYLENPNVELRVVNSRYRHELEAQKARFGLTCDLTVDGFEDLLARKDVDVVSICTVSSDHAREAILAARAGKHVFIEKPVATTLGDLRAMRNAIREAGVRSMGGFVVRYYPLNLAIKAILRQGLLGRVIYGCVDYWHEIKGEWKVNPETAGSALLMGGCHAVDTLRWYLEEEGRIVEVHAYSCPPRRRSDFKYDPTCVVNCLFESGAVGRCATSLECNMPYVLNVELEGTEGAIRNEHFYSTKIPGLRGFMEIPAMKADSPDVKHHPFPDEIADFIACILEGRRPQTDIEEAYLTHEVCFAADISAREKRPVKLPLPE
ncbi:MAG: Gfo/Idh/MocA family oxidoreductase [Planctomycetota bacterium]